MLEILSLLTEAIANNLLIVLLGTAAIWFTLRTRGVQFRMVGEMFRLLVNSGSKDNYVPEGEKGHHHISSFQAFAVSIASRVGTGNLAGVAIAIAVGGPGAVFWMWVIALLGAATAFIESTLAQLYKVRANGAYAGGPAYYIQLGIGKRWWAVTFAVLITLTFGLAFNTVQANTIADALSASISLPRELTGATMALVTLVIIWGGIRSVARFSEIVVPVMAIGYILLALVVIVMNFSQIPAILMLIVKSAFGLDSALGGTMGMAVVWGVKRGLFSNEAGEGSTPNAAATASVSHPVKQGLIQALGVFTDTLIICTATAFIILCSGAWTQGHDGIILTQRALDLEIGEKIGVAGFGTGFVSVAIFFFAFTSIIANYYYGETNLRFIRNSPALILVYRLVVSGMVYWGSVAQLEIVWGFADLTMALMTICNLAALAVLGKYAIRCLQDYQAQHLRGEDPRYSASTIPEIASQTPCWEK